MKSLMQRIALNKALALAQEYWSEVVVVSDSEGGLLEDRDHAAEIREAVLAQAVWREATFGITPTNYESDVAQTPAQPAPNRAVADDKSRLGALCGAESSDDSTAVGQRSATPSSEGSRRGGGHCWVYRARLADVPRMLAMGLSAPEPKTDRYGRPRRSRHEVKLLSGPWGRTGVGSAEVLVYVDVLAARDAGADLRFCSNGLMLGHRGHIPSACLRKMVRTIDAEVLYERRPLYKDAPGSGTGSDSGRESPVPSSSGAPSGSPLVGLLRKIDWS